MEATRIGKGESGWEQSKWSRKVQLSPRQTSLQPHADPMKCGASEEPDSKTLPTMPLIMTYKCLSRGEDVGHPGSTAGVGWGSWDHWPVSPHPDSLVCSTPCGR
jgi:hypothetical protein